MHLNKDEIKKFLPHRDPILMLDFVTEVIVGEKIESEVFVNPAWSIFEGHFPQYPILPGIYLTEAMAQNAALLLLLNNNNAGKLPILFSIQNMRFQRPVVPEDHLNLYAEIVTDAGNDLYDCKVFVKIEDKTVASGMITLALR